MLYFVSWYIYIPLGPVEISMVYCFRFNPDFIASADTATLKHFMP